MARARDERGREATRPREIPKAGWRDVLLRLKTRMREDRLSIVSAGVAFYALFALFPAITALVSFYGMVASPGEVASQASSMGGTVPPKALDLITSQMKHVAQSGGGTLSLTAVGGILLALWSASKGVKTLIMALNVAYREREKRGFLKLNGLALLLTLGAIVAVAVALGLVVAIPPWLHSIAGSGWLQTAVNWLRWPVLAAFMIAGLAVVYRYGPSRDRPRWHWVSWGAVAATVLWLAGSGLFSWYVSSFGSYDKTYGSLGAVIILLTWFLLTAYAIVIGAEINAEMERQTVKDTTEGRPEPMGRRGAYAADTKGRRP